MIPWVVWVVPSALEMDGAATEEVMVVTVDDVTGASVSTWQKERWECT